MKIFAILALILLALPANAALEDPNNLEIYINDAGYQGAICAWQNNDTGIWTVVYIGPDKNAKYFIGNETGYVRIT